MVLNFDDTNRKSQNASETVDDIDLLIGYVSEQMVQGLNDKVGRLLKDVRPGFDGDESRIVRSESSGSHHSVTCAKNSGIRFVCTPPCLNFQKYDVCSHALLLEFLNWAIKNGKKKYTPAATFKSSKNAGRKENKIPENGNPLQVTIRRNKTR